MSLIFTTATRQRAIFTLATLSLATTANAQAMGQTQESAPHDGGGMISDGWGWGMWHGSYGMGGYGFIGVLVLALVVIAVAVLAFRRRQP
ncbi:hypothetical protein MCRY_21915 [Marivita cryptomonadis]|jgi:hypothetical protein|uniref:hypothetical protein n=1 Tax=Marivita cryptomonadis TaxID=505252 RepID=UPI000A1F2122|nr:hypothetical protein [Marivita cryptomonadis]OSQ53713.1 hypothetical protein MCRY_21915 [Marivita cryptomonadis]